MRTIMKAASAAILAGAAAPALASTLVLYDLDAATGRRIAASPYADQEVVRMEKAGLIRGLEFPVDDGGAEKTRSLQLVSPQPLLPTGGVRTLVGRVVWTVTTRMDAGRLRYSNEISSEQGFSNGQGPLNDYRRSQVTVSGDVDARQSTRPILVESYSNNRGDRMMVGFLYP